MAITIENIVYAFSENNLPNARYKGDFDKLVIEAFNLVAIQEPQLELETPVEMDTPLTPDQVLAGRDMLVDFVRPQQGISRRDRMLRGGLSADVMNGILMQVIARELVNTQQY